METNILVSAAIAILVILVGVVVFFARKYFPVFEESAKAQIGVAQWNMLKGFIRTLILAAEQEAAKQGLDTGAKKKEFVVNKLMELTAQFNIPVTKEQVETLVEGVLKEIKRESSELVLGEILETTSN
jgi:hypothetical protein